MRDHVAILIVGYRCAADIRECLNALELSNHKTFSIHICENGGAESYADLVRELGSVARLDAEVAPAPAIVESCRGVMSRGQALRVHRATGNLGYAGALNALMATIGADPSWSAIWVLNPDTTVDPGAIGHLVAYAREGPYGIVGSRLISAETGTVDAYAGRWRKWMARGFNIGWGCPGDATPDVAAVERQMDYVSGAAMFVTRSFVEAVGPMDDRYFLYNEEVDWCFRRRKFRLGYAHAAIVYHRHGATIGSSHHKKHRSPLAVYLDERNKLLFTRRFYPGLFPIVLLVALALTGQYLVAGAYANFVHALRGWRDGVLGRDGRPGGLVPADATDVGPAIARSPPAQALRDQRS